MNKFNIPLFVLFLFNNNLQAAANTSFVEMIEKSLANSSKLESERNLEKSAIYNHKSEFRKYLPQLSISGSYNEYDSDVEIDEKYNKYDLTIDQKIIDFQSIASIAISNREKIAATYQRNIRESELILKTSLAYLDWLEANELQGIANMNLKNLTEHLRSTQKRFRGGDLTKTDLWQSNNRFAMAELQLENAKINFNTMKNEFVNIAGFIPPLNIKIPYLLKSIDKMNFSDIQNKLNENPIISLLLKKIEVTKAELLRMKSKHLPTLSFSGVQSKYQYQEGGDNDTETRLMLKVDLPLFSSGSDYASAKAIYYKKLSEEQNLLAKKREILEQLRSSLFEIRSKKVVLNKYSIASMFARKNLMGVNKEFKSGTKTNTDVLNAQRELITVGQSKIREQYGLAKRKLILIYNLGMLNKEAIGELE